MRFSVQQIKYELLAYMKEFDADFSNWTVGISHDPRNEIADLHQADMQKDLWIFKPAVSQIAATNVRNYFTRTLGCIEAKQADEEQMRHYVYAINRQAQVQHFGG